mgnify:CR=1 FL=1
MECLKQIAQYSDYAGYNKSRLKDARSEANFSQDQLAEMVVVSRNAISSIETDSSTQPPN